MAKKVTRKKTAKRKPSPSPSKAYITFECVVERSLNLLSLEEVLGDYIGAQKQKIDLSDLNRSALVLAVAAMDAYFTNVFIENFVKYLKDNGATKQLIIMLSEAGLDTGAALELLTMQRPYRRIRSLIESHLERTTTQRADAIDELFLGYGIRKFCQRAQGIAKRKNLIISIRNSVIRRNEIAHEGDINTHGKLQDIDRKQIRRKIQDIVKFVSSSEELLAKALL